MITEQGWRGVVQHQVPDGLQRANVKARVINFYPVNPITHFFLLPNALEATPGEPVLVTNRGTQLAIILGASGANQGVLGTGQAAEFVCLENDTPNGVWDRRDATSIGISGNVDTSESVYLLGNDGAAGTGFLRFDPELQAWEDMPPAPGSKAGARASGTFFGGEYGILAIGAGINDVDEFRGGSWAAKQPATAIPDGAGALSFGNAAYAFGGGANLAAKYNPNAGVGTWQVLPTITATMDPTTACNVGGSGEAIVSQTQSGSASTTLRYNLISDAWSNDVARPGSQTSGGTLCSFVDANGRDGALFVGGSLLSGATARQVWRYWQGPLGTRAWVSAKPLPSGVTGNGSAWIDFNQRAYVLGSSMWSCDSEERWRSEPPPPTPFSNAANSVCAQRKALG